MPGSSSGMTVWGALWTQSPVKQVKTIFKKQPIKSVEMVLEERASEETFILKNLLKLSHNSENLYYLNQDLLHASPSQFSGTNFIPDGCSEETASAPTSQSAGYRPGRGGHQHFSSCFQLLLLRLRSGKCGQVVVVPFLCPSCSCGMEALP